MCNLIDRHTNYIYIECMTRIQRYIQYIIYTFMTNGDFLA